MFAFRSIFSSVKYAVLLVFKKNLLPYFIPSIILAVLFYTVVLAGGSIQSRLDFMQNYWGLKWIYSFFNESISFISIVFFEFIILVALTPINSILAEKTIEDLTGITYQFSWRVLIKSIRRAIVVLTIMFFFQFLFLAIIWIASLLLGKVFYEYASILNLSFFIGFSFFDFALELDDIKAKNSWGFAKRNWLYCLVIGLIFSCSIYIPQKHEMLMIYLVGISIVPHLLTIISTHIYYSNKANL